MSKVVIFQLTGAAHGFMIMSCVARGAKKVGHHCSRLLPILCNNTLRRLPFIFRILQLASGVLLSACIPSSTSPVNIWVIFTLCRRVLGRIMLLVNS